MKGGCVASATKLEEVRVQLTDRSENVIDWNVYVGGNGLLIIAEVG